MKNIIIIALLLPVFCFGQYPNYQTLPYIIKKDTLKSKWSDAISTKDVDQEWFKKYRAVNTLWDSPNGVWLFDETPINIDTIQIIMLVSDTSHGSYTAMTSRTWTMKGYETKVQVVVNEKWSGCDGCTIEYTRLDTLYLDDKKQTLKKSYLVWMSKEIK